MATRDLWNQIDDEVAKPGQQWLDMTDAARRSSVGKVMADHGMGDGLAIEACNADGMIYFSQRHAFPVRQRADSLLDLEAALKRSIDPSLTVWIQPQTDKNSLRRLRGVTVRFL